jgi:hypothetical protein
MWLKDYAGSLELEAYSIKGMAYPTSCYAIISPGRRRLRAVVPVKMLQHAYERIT